MSLVSDLAANRLSSYLHRSIANPATRKSTELNLGLKELITSLLRVHVLQLSHARAFRLRQRSQAGAGLMRYQ